MYITAEAVDNMLAFIHKSSSAESIVAFDYAYASVLRGEKRYYGEKEIISSVSNAGEVWTFGIEEGAIRKFLSERGFKLVTEYTPPVLQKEYLTTEDGTQLGIINGTQSIVLAERT